MFKLRFLFVFLNIIFANIVSAGSPTSCNVNKECQFGFVCISGNAQSIDINTGITQADVNGIQTAALTGQCVPTVPIREACYFYEILTGTLGKAIVVLVLISLGIGWTTGKLETKQLLTVFTGVVLFFGSFQIVEYLMGVKGIGYCNLIDYTQPIGFPSQSFISSKM